MNERPRSTKPDSGATTLRCQACSSAHRVEIDRRALSGEDSRAIAAWLVEAGAPVSDRALRRHRENHLRPTEEAKAILAERQGPIVQAARLVVDDADTLAEIAEIGLTVARSLHRRMALPYDKKRTLADVTLFNGALREAREAAVARHEILNGKKVNVDARLSGGLAGLFAELERGDLTRT